MLRKGTLPKMVCVWIGNIICFAKLWFNLVFILTITNYQQPLIRANYYVVNHISSIIMPGMSSESPVVPGIIDSVNSGFINLGWHPLSNINFICLKVYHSVSYQNDGNNPIKKSDSQRTFTKYLKSCIQNYLTIANVGICFNLHLCIYIFIYIYIYLLST